VRAPQATGDLSLSLTTDEASLRPVVSEVDVALLVLPRGEGRQLAKMLLDRGVRVVDLGGVSAGSRSTRSISRLTPRPASLRPLARDLSRKVQAEGKTSRQVWSALRAPASSVC